MDKYNASAPELRIDQWIDENGKETKAIRLADYKGRFKILFCFQFWCPGCHSVGFPSLQKLVDAFKESNSIAFLRYRLFLKGNKQTPMTR